MFYFRVIALLLTFSFAACGNILFLNGIASPSHHLWNRKLVNGLVEKGFNVTMVSVDNDPKPAPNVHYIHLEAAYEAIYSGEAAFDLLEMADQSALDINSIYGWCEANCDGILNSKGLDLILNYPDNFKFDAVIYDYTCGPCLLPLVHKFNYPPLISVSAFNNPPYSLHLTGGNKYPAFVPHFFVEFPQLMSFPERCFNTLIYLLDTYYRQYDVMGRMEKKVRERFNFKDYPHLIDLEKKTALMLVNTDDSIDFPEPLQPNVIQIGGLQIIEAKPLPEKMLKFVESGKKGTVLMSLGTNMKSNMLGEERLKNIITTFAQLPDYNFVWKFESEESELPIKLPKNVLVAKFLPQNDILAHPNVKAFATHSGLLSSQESLWYGKPMIAIPFFVDQKRSANKWANMQVAVKVDFRTLDVKGFKEAILTVLEDKTYWENAQRISKLFQDKPQRPLDTAVWWIEYAIRNPSAPQFQPIALKLGWFVSNSYDVILAFIVVVHLLLYFILKITKRIAKLFCGHKVKKLKKN